jgi:hypothetical protein
MPGGATTTLGSVTVIVNSYMKMIIIIYNVATFV